MRNKKIKIGASIGVALLIIIISAFFMLRNNDNSSQSKVQKNVSSEKLKTDNKKDNKSNKNKESNSEKKPSETETAKKSEENKEPEKQDAANAVIPEASRGASDEGNIESNPGSNETSNPGNPPSQPEDNIEVTPEKKEKYVTMSITCNTILNNLDKVSDGKKDIVPANGVILGEITVQINEGDTVFDVLARETRSRRIHMDFVESPVYNSAYIKGIANLYEFDAGDLSGWMYSVNGSFPGYGCSQYKLNDGDVIQWKYTCDLGNDL